MEPKSPKSRAPFVTIQATTAFRRKFVSGAYRQDEGSDYLVKGSMN